LPSNGRTNGIASPSSEAQAAAIRQAYASAGITDFNDTAYLECHGTGTPAGDPIEVNGAGAVFGPTRDADRPLIIGSVWNHSHLSSRPWISNMTDNIFNQIDQEQSWTLGAVCWQFWCHQGSHEY
jgi:hypothetical protein